MEKETTEQNFRGADIRIFLKLAKSLATWKLWIIWDTV